MFLARKTRLMPVLLHESDDFIRGFAEIGIILIMFALGFGTLGRAELAFVVLDIAFVQESIISEDVFYTLMLTAFWLNVALPVSIALWKPYCAGEKTLGFLAPPRDVSNP